jgi:hypothetical protein
MKKLTQSIYNIITSENFTDIHIKLEEKVNMNNWTIPERNEFTYEELLNELPDCIDILKQNIEDGTFDNLPYYTRNTFLQSLQNINNAITNIYNNSQQFATVQDHTQNLILQIRINRLDFEAKRIPKYKEKISEYRQLIEELNTAKQIINQIKEEENDFSILKQTAEQTLESIKVLFEEANEKHSSIFQYFDTAQETINQINALLETIKENKESTIRLLEEASSSNRTINDIRDELINYQQNIDESENELKEIISKTQQKVIEYSERTEGIIKKNLEQTQEIDKQLQKAVGVSLFSTFEERKTQLSKTSKWWLFLIFISIVATVILSYSVISDFLSNVHQYNEISKIGWSIDTNTSMPTKPVAKLDIDWMWIVLKLTLLLPLIYLISFATSRYSKERRLVEEYAFKSTISFALKPYSDLVQKIESEDTDSKYRDFLISSIESIFSVPTDKAFGSNKKDSKDLSFKNLDEVMKFIEKIKKFGME